MNAAALTLVMLTACGAPADPAAPPAAAPHTPAAAPPPTEAAAPIPTEAAARQGPDGEAVARADAAIKRLQGALKDKLMGAMPQGPAAAVEVCANEAGAVRAAVAAETGVAVGRATLRPRNPENVGPAWVAGWLAERGERKAQGAGDLTELVDEQGRRVARRLVPIAIDPPCLVCHGPADTLAPEVKALLAARYPADQATGYALGDLRGAFWAEAPVEVAAR